MITSRGVADRDDRFVLASSADETSSDSSARFTGGSPLHRHPNPGTAGGFGQTTSGAGKGTTGLGA